MKWSNIKFRNKLIIGYGILILMSALIVYQSLQNFSNILVNTKSAEEADHVKLRFTKLHIDHLIWINKISNTLLNNTENLLNVETDPHRCAMGNWFYGGGREKLENLVPGLKQSLDSLEILHERLHKSAGEINEYLSKGNKADAKMTFIIKTTKYLQDIGNQIQVVNNKISHYAMKADKESELGNRSEKAKLIIMGIVTLVTGIFLAWIITISLIKGIYATVKASHQISNGVLNVDIDARLLNRNDEIGELLKSFHGMSDKLKSIVVSIKNVSGYIATAGQQIKSATMQLSERTNEQASSLEEISSSVDEMTSTIQQNADSALQADNVSAQALNKIQESSIAVKNSTQSIKDIAVKNSIIGDIAFQTNILALNAAVEAARAGEKGKGFAVVAAEVRKLAERSKISADEISMLSKNGVETAELAGKQFTEVLPDIEITVKLVKEISAASSEQSLGIKQINDSIQVLNQASQENASTSEEIASSTEELSSQAEALKKLVSFFKMDEKIENDLKGLENKKEDTPPEDNPDSNNHQKTVKLQMKTSGEISDDDFETF